MSDDPLSPRWRVQLLCVCYDAFIDLRPAATRTNTHPNCARLGTYVLWTSKQLR